MSPYLRMAIAMVNCFHCFDAGLSHTAAIVIGVAVLDRHEDVFHGGILRKLCGKVPFDI